MIKDNNGIFWNEEDQVVDFTHWEAVSNNQMIYCLSENRIYKFPNGPEISIKGSGDYDGFQGIFYNLTNNKVYHISQMGAASDGGLKSEIIEEIPSLTFIEFATKDAMTILQNAGYVN